MQVLDTRQTCQNCRFTDGSVYLSDPVQYKCTFDNEYHYGLHACHLEFAPVVHGRWKYYHKQNIAVCTNCSFERNLDANFGRAISCPNCGAKMDLKGE